MDATKLNGTKPSATAEKPRQSRAEKLLDAKVDTQIEKLVKSLGSEATAEQKMLILAKQCVEFERESGRRATAIKQNEKCMEQVQREKENLQKEYNKGVLMRDKLEQVCREQQKLMKSIKSECSSRIREEEEKRKETQAHFQKSINDIFATLGKNNEENIKLKEANLDMTKKFKYLAEQYELREKQLGKINEQIQLEGQLNEAKLAKSKMESVIEKEILLKEKEAVLVDLMSTKQAIIDMQDREKVLKGQLNMYTDKYAEFQTSLQKSNEVFGTYKSEIVSMSKRTKTLEKESYDWRHKYEKCNRALLNMAGDKQTLDAYVAKSARQVAQLQKLCRTLHAERAALIEVLAANNIERPAAPELPPAPTDIEPPPKSADKLDIMSRNCMELKKSLAQLQGQMNALEQADAAKPNAPKAAAATTAATKKPKNKKPKAKAATAAATMTPVAEDDENSSSNAPTIAVPNGDDTAETSGSPIANGSETAVNGNETTSSSSLSENGSIEPLEALPEQQTDESISVLATVLSPVDLPAVA